MNILLLLELTVQLDSTCKRYPHSNNASRQAQAGPWREWGRGGIPNSFLLT